MNVQPIISRLCQYVEARNFAGYDPYDALNSPLLRAGSLGTKWGRIAAIQFMKRCPLNLRPLLLCRPGHNPKAIGLFLHGYVRLRRAGKISHGLSGDASAKPGGMGGTEADIRHIDHLLALLDALRSPGYSGNGWGYNFDWQSRAAYVPRGTPTIVNTAFIGHALLDTWEWLGNTKALDLALPIADFMLNDLNRLGDGDRFCFSYTPQDHNYVHNANLLGASVLARIAGIGGSGQALGVSGRRTEDGRRKAGERGRSTVGGKRKAEERTSNIEHPTSNIERETALKALRYSMKHQRPDGSWPYAETVFQGWIDSFHTGFNLQAIKVFLDLGLAEECREGFEKGVRYYADTFFLPDGTPKYYHDRVYPVDIHCPAQALVFFSSLAPRYDALCERLLKWMLANLWDEKQGYFYFQKTRRFTNRIPYIRWAQAWALHGLTAYRCRDRESG